MKKLLTLFIFIMPLLSIAEGTYKITWWNNISPWIRLNSDKFADKCIHSVEPANFNMLQYARGMDMTLVDSNNAVDCVNSSKYQYWHIKDTDGNIMLTIKFFHWLDGLPVIGNWKTSINVSDIINRDLGVNAYCYADGQWKTCLNSSSGVKNVKKVCIVFSTLGQDTSTQIADLCDR